jgi:hypothetical protein
VTKIAAATTVFVTVTSFFNESTAILPSSESLLLKCFFYVHDIKTIVDYVTKELCYLYCVTVSFTQPSNYTTQLTLLLQCK